MSPKGKTTLANHPTSIELGGARFTIRISLVLSDSGPCSRSFLCGRPVIDASRQANAATGSETVHDPHGRRRSLVLFPGTLRIAAPRAKYLAKSPQIICRTTTQSNPSYTLVCHSCSADHPSGNPLKATSIPGPPGKVSICLRRRSPHVLCGLSVLSRYWTMEAAA